MLLGVRIKRISLFDIEKNRKDIEEILAELEQVEKDLKGLNGYTIRYIKRLIKEYKDQYPRCTEATSFKEADVRELTASELQIKRDENGYIGTKLKSESPQLFIIKGFIHDLVQPLEDGSSIC